MWFSAVYINKVFSKQHFAHEIYSAQYEYLWLFYFENVLLLVCARVCLDIIFSVYIIDLNDSQNCPANSMLSPIKLKAGDAEEL